MRKQTYRLQLRKDAELGTGLGGEAVNELVPRGFDGNPIIPASHIKGLMRASLREIAKDRKDDWQAKFPNSDPEKQWPDAIIDKVFGPEEQEDADYEPAFFLEDARVWFDPASAVAESRPRGDKKETGEKSSKAGNVPTLATRFVSRTAIEANGIALDTSLRTTEAVPKATVFAGNIFSDVDDDRVERLAWQLALLTISAVGGSRNRGGQCVVEFHSENEQNHTPQPGELLKQLDDAIKNGRFHQRKIHEDTRLAGVGELTGKATIIELLFMADSPICCPERPDKTNVIASGFSIPATAVQGIILNHINRRNPQLASDLFNNTDFRCWPLNPCINPADGRENSRSQNGSLPEFDDLPCSIRVSLSHRAAKHSAGVGLKKFFDEAFGPRVDAYDWRDKPEFAPLKAMDGVLLFGGKEMQDERLLWRAAAMPRQISTHGVLDGPQSRSDTRNNERNGRRNLFSVDAMAPLIWRGLISVPENVAQSLVDSLNQHPQTSIGKGKTVRGLGKLRARLMPDDSRFFAGAKEHEQTVFVLQSPALIPDNLYQDLVAGEKSADEILKLMAKDWLEKHGLPQLAGKPDVWASVDIRFGWNRHGSDASFQQALPVLSPGSVFTLASKADPQKLKSALLAGFHAQPADPDPGRQRGFGAIAVHPGQAKEFYGETSRTRREFESTPLRAAMEIVLRLERLPFLPSPSQIRAVEQRIKDNADDTTNKASLEEAKEYLTKQCSKTLDVWYAWEPVIDELERLLTESSPAVAKKALKSLADIAVSKRKEER